jgi:hypothetical protein
LQAEVIRLKFIGKSTSSSGWISFFCAMKIAIGVVSCIVTASLLLPGSFFMLREAMLDSGWSWTLTEWLPYVLLIAAGVGIRFSIAPKLKTANRIARISLSMLLVAAPFLIGFTEHPIYEDAVSNSSLDMSTVETTLDYAGADLVVIAIPDCPYCARAAQDMLLMHKRKPELNMRMVVCTSDSTWLPPYAEVAQGAFEVVMASDMDVMATHANGHFPSFISVENDSPVRRWNNNQWGPLAKDAVEKGERVGGNRE